MRNLAGVKYPQSQLAAELGFDGTGVPFENILDVINSKQYFWSYIQVGSNVSLNYMSDVIFIDSI